MVMVTMWFRERSTRRIGVRPLAERRRASCFALTGGALLWLQPGSTAASDAPPSLKVSGAATLAAETRAVGDGYEARVSLRDEVGRPIAGAEVLAEATGSDAAPRLRRCGDSRGEGGPRVSVTTDSAGQACVSIRDMAAGELALSFEDPRGYFERATRAVQVPESATAAFELAFDPPLSAVSLDQPSQTIGVLVRGRAGAEPPGGAELVLSLAADGAERELARVALDGLGEARRLSLESPSFGTPGPARLVASLRVPGGREPASTSTAILRTATVALQLASGSGDQVEPGAKLELRATWALGPAPKGVVEARSQGRSLAVARVQQGSAQLVLPAAHAAPLGKSVTLEYLGEGPGWLSGPALELSVKPPGRSYGRYALWIGAAVLAALAVVLGWRRPARLRPAATPASPRHRASVEVLESFGAGGGYRGQVCDAHEGTPISPAALSFVAPGSGGRVLLQIRTGADGRFEVDAPTFPSGTLVEVTAPFHATLTAPLPGPGVLQLSLVSRRRALLDRLVRWAERHGRPWTRQVGDPTPAHVALAAGQEGAPQVERWARAVEQLAYGPNAPDAASERAAGLSADPELGPDSSAAAGIRTEGVQRH